MAINLHWHRFPSCGTQHNTACSTIAGTETNCIQATTGPHRGEWGCVHVTGATISPQELTEFVDLLFRELAEADVPVQQAQTDRDMSVQQPRE